MKTKIIAAFTALVIMTGVAILGISPAHAAPYDSFVQTIIDRTNQLRADNGLAPVAYDAQIAGVSQEWAQHLQVETQDPMWDPSGVHRYDAGLSLFPGAVYASENVAINSDADRVFAAWRDSPGHLANMLAPEAQSIGVGYVLQTAGPYAGQYVVVENFAGYGTSNTPVAAPLAPSVIDQSTISIPAVEGVEYLLNGQVVAAGSYPVSGAVVVEARAVEGYVLASDAPTRWDYNFSIEVAVTPFAPTFANDAKTYTIPTTEGVEYFVNGAPVAAGTYDGAGTVAVSAYAVQGYVLSAGVTSEWSFTYTDVAPTATPAAPSFDDASRTYTVPSATGVDYLVNGEFARPGIYNNAPDTVTIVAQAQAGYVLDANAISTWTHSYSAATTEIEAIAPTFNDAERTYVIPFTPGVQYGVNGNIVSAGTYPVLGNKTVINVDAFAAPGYSFKADTATNWSHTFEAVSTPVEAVAPTLDEATRIITIPAVDGLEYTVNGEVVVGALPVGDAAAEITVNVRALDGYTLTAGSQTSWNFSVAAVEEPAQPIDVEVVVPTSDEAARTITIPSVEGVEYLVNGEVATGTITAGNGATTYTITARALEGYNLTNAPQSPWTFSFAAVETPATDIEVAADAPNFNEVDRTVTIPTIEGVEYLIDGGVVSGVLDVSDARTEIHVSARAKDGYKLTTSSSAQWSFTFAAVETPATPVKVEAPAPIVDETARTITIPSVQGVEYLVNGEVATGVVSAGPATATFNIAARALPGYELVNAPAEPWTITIAAAVDTNPVTPTDPVVDTPATPGTPPSDDDVVVNTPATPGTPPSDDDVVVDVPTNNDDITVDTNGDVVAGTDLGRCPAVGGPFLKGESLEYSSARDGDNDGIACEDGEGLADTGADKNVILYAGIAGIAFLLIGGTAYGATQRRRVVSAND